MKITKPELYLRPGRNTYYARWTQGGKQKWRAMIPPNESSATKDPLIAHRLFKLFLNDFYAGKVVPLADKIQRSFFLFCKEFLADIEHRLSYNTYLLYDEALKKAKNVFGDIPMDHISIRLLERYQTELLAAGLARPTVNKNYRHLKAALNKAIDWEYMTPFKQRLPKQLPVKKGVKYLTQNQIRALMEKISDPEFYDMCAFALFTGMRSGEILRLTFDDVDNPPGFIRIINEQKNKHESNHPISPMVRELIDRCRSRQPGRKRLFRFQSVSTVSHLYAEARENADVLGGTSFHCLRHSYASHLVMSGESLKLVQDLMRHLSFTSTLEYAHLAPQHLIDGANRVNYGPIPGPPPKIIKNKK